MKALTILSSFALCFCASAFASPAVSYTCVGKNNVSGEAVVFELLFADYAPGHGYTNESITIIKRGWEQLQKPLVLQMKGATNENNCEINEENETYMHGGFEMVPAENITPDYKVSFKSACREDQKFDVSGYCYYQN